MITVDRLVEGLQTISEKDFTLDNVYDYLGSNPLDTDSLAPYVFWSERFYTRNLIFKNELFEVMTLCWEKGQVSRVHDHAVQNCWMTVVSGKLHGQNYAPVAFDWESGSCTLAETTSFDLSDCLTAKVEIEEPIHQILNLPEFDERAISLHVYSRPIERCNAFCLKTNTFKEVELFYTSVHGKLCEGVAL